MPWNCGRCLGRTRWCHWCKVRHCPCRPHVSRKRKYLHKVLVIKREDGTHRIMAARRYAHLKGAQRGGKTTATRPNPGRFTLDAARKASQARWQGRHRMNRLVGIRLGIRRKRIAPTANRSLLRYLYSRAFRLGIHYIPVTRQWVQQGDNFCHIISERTALRRLGHLPYARKNWVPGEHEVIIAHVDVGMGPAEGRARRRQT